VLRVTYCETASQKQLLPMQSRNRRMRPV